MPELPDINLYVEKLDERVRGQVLKDIRISKPFLVRSFDPPLSTANGKRVTELRRVGKRIVFGLEPDYWLILHLMIAGRLHWHDEQVAVAGKNKLAAFDFSNGCLILTEAGSKKKNGHRCISCRVTMRWRNTIPADSSHCNAVTTSFEHNCSTRTAH
jgi:formamidopyrimidine-DNA glycosylase